MHPLSPEVSYETKILERLELGVQQALSRHMLHGIRVHDRDFIVDDLAHSIAMRLRAHVWTDPNAYHKVHEITYVPIHPTWKHHLTASLPRGSFLRRWCHFFWDIPFDYANERVTEKVEVHVKALFPENTMHYPEHLGRAQYHVSINPLDTLTEHFYG